MRSSSEGAMRTLPVIAAAALLIGLSACSSWMSGSSTRSSDSSSPMQSGGSGSSTPRMSESQVRQDLSDHGYSNVSGLHPSDNDWTGSATDSSGTPLNFDVDPQGVIVIIP